jgi:hypothetical protein
MVTRTVVNVNCIKDIVEIIQRVYHVPNADSHMWTTTFAEKLLAGGPGEIFKMTKVDVDNHYRPREFLVDYSAGYLVEKLDEYLATQNQPQTLIERPHYPPIQFLKEALRVSDPSDSMGTFSPKNFQGLFKPAPTGPGRKLVVEAGLSEALKSHVSSSKRLSLKRFNKLERTKRCIEKKKNRLRSRNTVWLPMTTKDSRSYQQGKS